MRLTSWTHIISWQLVKDTQHTLKILKENRYNDHNLTDTSLLNQLLVVYAWYQLKLRQVLASLSHPQISDLPITPFVEHARNYFLKVS